MSVTFFFDIYYCCRMDFRQWTGSDTRLSRRGNALMRALTPNLMSALSVWILQTFIYSSPAPIHRRQFHAHLFLSQSLQKLSLLERIPRREL